jgi:hypothetical protein
MGRIHNYVLHKSSPMENLLVNLNPKRYSLGGFVLTIPTLLSECRGGNPAHA